MIVRMNYQQYRTARRLVHSCCNYDCGNCLPLDDGLCAALLHRADMKKCVLCGGSYLPKSNRAKYCPECAVATRRKKEAERQRKRYYDSTHLEPKKVLIFQGFPGAAQ